ncbi:Zinc finger protein 318 [Dissostichus eleginoides]|uniref:Zinc finger protein 318 n=1 Tax=Dissostichus eleginoides TaxID=100907 RepID=A0AAD9CNP9_DISEL|nr:Zinc finger protein 318 [Dissostichus eleginoides]
MSQVADQLLQAVKGMEPHLVASVLSELRSDPQMAQRIGLDAEIKEILHMLGGPAGAQDRTEDIDDEEKFLYGDAEDPKLPSEPVRPQGLDLYGDVTEDALYDDYPPSQEPVDERYRASVSPDQNLTGPEPPGPGERQALDEYEKIQDLLKTIGMDLGVTEISKMAARTKERLHGNKPPPKTPTRRQRSSGRQLGGGPGSQEAGPQRQQEAEPQQERSHSSSSSGKAGAVMTDAENDQFLPIPQTQQRSSAEKTAAAAPPNIEPPLKTPGFVQYGNYLPYMPGQWPPMYPPPTMAMPPNTSPEEFPPSLPYPNPYSTPPDHQGAQGVMKVKVGSQERKVSEEQNTESQKQKEVSRLQEEVMSQISSLRREHESAEKKRNEIEKIALILGLIPSDRPRPPRPEDEAPPPQTPEKKKGREGGGSREGRGSPEAACSSLKLHRDVFICNLCYHLVPQGQSAVSARCCAAVVARRSLRGSDWSPDAGAQRRVSGVSQSPAPFVSPSSIFVSQQPAAPPPPNDPPEPFEYYDAGNHWCKNCNVTSGSMFDFYTHLHSKTHRKTLDPYDRPWSGTTGTTGTSKSLLTEEKLTKPAKGSAAGAWPEASSVCSANLLWRLNLCRGARHQARHNEKYKVRHNRKYRKQMYENPLYEQRRNLDRQAGLTSDAGGKKRKHEDEEERPSFSKKDEEEEQVKGSKKEDKYRHRREEEDRYKYSREEEHRHRYDNRPKYGPRDEDFKHGKYPRVQIQPYDPPKILCGPSPAMRAKLRKQSLEVGKPAAGPASLTSPTFGKFTWKKRENFLAKEAEKVAAEFIKEDEAAANLDPAPAQDSFSKSMAVAKEIAQKLGGHQTPPWVSNGANRGRIRPNLPAPAAVLRKTALMGKPAPLNTFLSMRPQGGGLPVQQEVQIISDGLLKIPNARKKPQESKPLPPSPAPGDSYAPAPGDKTA